MATLVLTTIPIALSDDALGASAGERRARVEIERESAGTLPDEVAIGYYEPARDYQAGLQRARRGGPGRRVESVDLAAVLDVAAAKALAERRLARIWAERAKASVALPPRFLPLRPGSTVQLPARPETFRVAGWTLEHMALELRLVGMPAFTAGGVGASAGRPVTELDAAAGTTILALLDLPPLEDAPATTPRLWIAAAGTGAGWRKAQLIASLDGGASYRSIGSTAPAAVIGTALDALAAGDPALFDLADTIEVQLANPAMWLEGRDDDALVAGANLAMLGDELIQFGFAQPTSTARFRLGRLLRGRRGTECAVATHLAGERFVLIEAATLLPLEAPVSALDTTARIMATGVGDAVAVAAEAVIAGRALRPPASVHLSASRLADGTIRIGWVRRSRVGWAWLDGGEAALGEEAERYRLIITPEVGSARNVETTIPGYDYLMADQEQDGAASAGAIDVTVAQLGSIAATRPVAAGHFIL